MFIQVIRGRVSDRDAIRSATDRWHHELAPGAKGFLGSTGGVTDDGTLIEVVRFESAEAARSNSDRPEQQAWWDETSILLDGDATFYDCPVVDSYVAGDSEAGFVQVSICRVSDVPAARKLGAEFAEIAPRVRPDLVGFIDAYTEDGVCITTSYFTSEAEATEAEKAEMPPEHQAVFESFRSLVSEYESFDLRNPHSFNPS